MLAIQAQSDIESPRKNPLNQNSPRSNGLYQEHQMHGESKRSSGGPFTSKPPMSDYYVREKHQQLQQAAQNDKMRLQEYPVNEERKQTIEYGAKAIVNDSASMNMSGISSNV